MDELARGRSSPPAFEEGLEPRRAGEAREPPALVGNDRGEEAARVAARGLRGEPVDAVEEARLVLGAEVGVAPVAGDGEPAHSRELGELVEGTVAEPVVDRVRVLVRGGRDHACEHGTLVRVRHPVADRAEVGGEQHRLDEARAHVDAVRGEAAQAAPVVDQRPRVRAAARLEVALHREDALARREARGEGVRRHPAAAAGSDRCLHPRQAAGQDPDAPAAAVGGRVEEAAVPVAGPLVADHPVAARAELSAHAEPALVLEPLAHHHGAARVAHTDVRQGALDVQAGSREGLPVVERARRGVRHRGES